MSIKYICLLLVSITLSSCGNKKINYNIDQNSNILVISNYSDTLVLDEIGSTMFGDHIKRIDNFGINANKLILDYFKNTQSSTSYVPYYGIENLNFNENKSKIKSLAIDCNCKYILLIQDTNVSHIEFFGEYEGFGIKKKKNYGQQFTYKYVTMNLNLIETSTLTSVANLSDKNSTSIFSFPTKKLRELNREDVKMFRYAFDSLLKGLIDKFLLRMELI